LPIVLGAIDRGTLSKSKQASLKSSNQNSGSKEIGCSVVCSNANMEPTEPVPSLVRTVHKRPVVLFGSAVSEHWPARLRLAN
jgi:hypothetical protein